MAARLRPADLLVLLLAAVLAVISLVVWTRIPGGRWMIAADVLLIVFVLALRRGGDGRVVPQKTLRSRLGWESWFADFYFAPVVYLFYRQACLVARALHDGRTYDALLVDADRLLFGLDPTRWLASYTNPVVTEVLQLAYASFYLLLLLVAWDLLRSGKRQQFEVFSFGVIYGFGLSYLGYWLLPSVGPRFVLHDFAKLDSELPGLIFTPYLRAFVNWGGAIGPGASNAEALARAYPDVFPSGHAMMTMALIFWSFRYSSGVRWFIFGAGSLLIVSTVYLRYHYVIDVLAGAGLAVFCLASHGRLFQLTQELLAGASRNVERAA